MTPLAISRLLAVSTLALGVLSPLTAAAKTCAADSECNANQKCEDVASPSVGIGGCPPCADSGPCEPCDTTPVSPMVVKECVDQPISCTTNADCPSYLACADAPAPDVACPPCDPSAGGSCPACEPAPAPSGKKVCTYVERKCAADADCGAGFSCQTSQSGSCSGSSGGCSPDGDCPKPEEPTCTTETITSCQLKIIACTQNSECPADFSCETVSTGSCGEGSTGTGSTGTGTRTPDSTPPSSGGGTPAPTPPAPSPQDGGQGGDCTTTTQQVCIPKGLGFGSQRDASGSLGGGQATPEASGNGKGTAAGANGQPTNAEAAPANGSSDDGCSTSGAGQRGASAWSLLLVAASLIGLGKRRRSA